MSNNKGNLADIGLAGLAVMGQNLVLNMADHGFKVAVFNRTTATMQKFVAENPGTPGGLIPCVTLEQLVQAIKRPRQVIILVRPDRRSIPLPANWRP
jgi:6-phosphogluconate dehydrogenase